MRNLVLTEQDFTQIANTTALSAYAEYELPSGLYMEFDMSSRFVFKPVLVESFSIATNMVHVTTLIVTVPLSFQCVDDSPVTNKAIVAYDVDAEVYLTFTAYNASTKVATFSWHTSPKGHTLDVYYAASQHFDKLAIAVPVGTGEDVYPVKSYDQGRLFILDQNSSKQALYLPKPAALIENFKIVFMTRDTVRHAIANIRDGTPISIAKLELPVIVGSISEARARFGANVKGRLLSTYRQMF